MTLPKRVKQIVDELYPSITWLRSMSKEDLVRSILEMKRTLSDNSMKKLNMDHSIAMASLEIRKLELQSKLEVTNGMLQYGAEIKEHRYGPKAIGHVSSSLATIWNGDETNLKGSGKLIDGSDLETRANMAEEQGIVWNLQNKRPERESTIRRKVEEWEKGIERGLKADPTIFCSKDPDDIKKEGSDYKAFMTGLCIQMEASLGKDPMNRYLVPRFRNIAKAYKKTLQPVVAPLPPVETGHDKAKTLVDRIYTEWLGPDYRDAVKQSSLATKLAGTLHLERMTEKHEAMVEERIGTAAFQERNFAVEILNDITQPYTFDLVKDRFDWHVVCQREKEYTDYRDVHQAYRQLPETKEKFNDLYYRWWLGMCDRLGV